MHNLIANVIDDKLSTTSSLPTSRFRLINTIVNLKLGLAGVYYPLGIAFVISDYPSTDNPSTDHMRKVQFQYHQTSLGLMHRESWEYSKFWLQSKPWNIHILGTAKSFPWNSLRILSLWESMKIFVKLDIWIVSKLVFKHSIYICS